MYPQTFSYGRTQSLYGRMLAGLSARRDSACLEPVGKVEARATSKSAISRRFIQGTEQKLAELFGRDLSQLDLVAVFLDGIEVAEHCAVVALGVDAEGRKQPLGLWQDTTENKTVCNALLSNLIERGLTIEQPRLFVIDGGKAIRADSHEHLRQLRHRSAVTRAQATQRARAFAASRAHLSRLFTSPVLAVQDNLTTSRSAGGVAVRVRRCLGLAPAETSSRTPCAVRALARTPTRSSEFLATCTQMGGANGDGHSLGRPGAVWMPMRRSASATVGATACWRGAWRPRARLYRNAYEALRTFAEDGASIRRADDWERRSCSAAPA